MNHSESREYTLAVRVLNRISELSVKIQYYSYEYTAKELAFELEILKELNDF